MSKSFRCRCGKEFTVDSVGADGVVQCPHCGHHARVRQPPDQESPVAAAPIATNAVVLHIRYPGRSFAWDVNVGLAVDGQPVGQGWLIKGVDVSAELTPGRHTLEVTAMKSQMTCELDLSEPGEWEAVLRYSRWTGGFSRTVELRRLGDLVGTEHARKEAGQAASGLGGTPDGAPQAYRPAIEGAFWRQALMVGVPGFLLGVLIGGPRSQAHSFSAFARDVLPWALGASVLPIVAMFLGRVVGRRLVKTEQQVGGAASSYAVALAVGGGALVCSIVRRGDIFMAIIIVLLIASVGAVSVHSGFRRR